MKRATIAALLSAVLVLALSVVAATRDVPYVTFQPGPTVNVLSDYGKKPIIQVTGRQAYRDKGGLRLLTVIPSGPEDKVSLVELVKSWVSPDDSVYPREAVYGAQDTGKSVRQQSTAQMDTSQDDAIAAALRALGVGYTSYSRIDQVQPKGPADGKLKTGDRVLRVDGTKVTSARQLIGLIRRRPVGSPVTVTVRRDGRAVEERMRTTRSPADPRASAVLVTIAPGYEFPFDVRLNIDKNIGGPSGGLMFSLGIYDVLTPGSLTGGETIAGTGEIDSEGKVGEIGGIQQKLVAAQDAGAKLFLAPAGNCAEALGGNFDPRKMRLVKVTSMAGALADVKAWVANHDARLPRCTP